MPRYRYLTIASQTPTLSTYTDPRTSRIVLVSTTEEGVPTAVTVTETALTLTSTGVELWTFTGNVEGALWQIDVMGTGETRSVRATTSA